MSYISPRREHPMSAANETTLYAKIAEGSPDAFIFSDREGIIRLWNRGAETMFGYTMAEAVGQSLDLIIPENLRKRHWDGYHRVMDTGVTHYGTELLAAPGLRKDGTRLSLEFSMSLVRHDDGTMAGTGAIIRDITEKWKKEKALKERLAELEAKQGA